MFFVYVGTAISCRNGLKRSFPGGNIDILKVYFIVTKSSSLIMFFMYHNRWLFIESHVPIDRHAITIAVAVSIASMMMNLVFTIPITPLIIISLFVTINGEVNEDSVP